MCVMAVVCVPWSCGTEKCPFDFGRTTCVLFRAEERTEERTEVWRKRRVLQTPEAPGNGCLTSDPGGSG